MTFNDNARLNPSQVEDRRGSGSMFGGGGGGRGMGGPVIAGGGGLGIVVMIVAMLLGVNPFEGGAGPAAFPDQNQVAVGQQPASQTTAECQTGADANQRDDCRIVGFVNSIQDYWQGEFARRNAQYTPAKTVLFSGATQTACGTGSQAQGPFYCPQDQRIYLDLTFFRELSTRFGARSGPFAQAYVVAHEYGHHLQNVLNLLPEGQGTSGSQGSQVRVELMADCFAGVWVHNAAATGYLQPPSNQDIGDALSAAAAVGDDRIQKQMQGSVHPETWTHGSADQRTQWFQRGYQSGDMNSCNTTQGRV